MLAAFSLPVLGTAKGERATRGMFLGAPCWRAAGWGECCLPLGRPSQGKQVWVFGWPGQGVSSGGAGLLPTASSNRVPAGSGEEEWGNGVGGGKVITCVRAVGRDGKGPHPPSLPLSGAVPPRPAMCQLS